MNELRLDGCRPTPLASYLKALGVLRLVAEQNADPEARGFWHGERFHLKTRLDRDALRRFFLEDYAPTPIIAPWNGRAGFLEGESGSSDGEGAEGENGEEEQQSTREGAKLRRSYEQAGASRFGRLRDAVCAFGSLPTMTAMDSARAGWKTIQKSAGKRKPTREEAAEIARLKRIEKEKKEDLVASLRNEVAEEQYAWLEVCIRVAESRGNSPLLIGGGADGSRDYGMAFGIALQQLFSFESGQALEGSGGPWLAASLFGDAAPLAGRDSLGHFQPGQGGYNGTTGVEGYNPLDPWDVVLALEGAVLWSGGVTRRLDSAADTSAASFPFCVEVSRSGAGQLSGEDQNRAPGEVWCPVWSRPTGLSELRSLFREGRLTVGKRSARNGLDAALAVAALGRSRGIVSFVRVGLYQSDAKMPHTAAPLRRHIAGAAPDAALLGAELVDHWWLLSLRRHARTKEAPAALRDEIRLLEDALFELPALPGQNGSGRADRVQAVLIAYGRLARIVSSRPKLREALKSPPPVLNARWAAAADDGSAEFRIAAALAGLRAKLATDVENGTEAHPEPAAENRRRYGLYMRQHLAPLDPDLPYPKWDPHSGATLAVWGPGSLIDNLCAVAQRRLLAMHQKHRANKPFDARFGADSEAICEFLEASERLHRRVAELVAGLAWVEPAPPRGSSAMRTLPFAFAALKPLFARNDAVRAARRGLPKTFNLPTPPALPNLLLAGRVDDAVQLGMARARSSGLPTPFMRARVSNASNYGRRLLAALTIPVRIRVLRSCLDQAYPPEKDKEDAA
jgi:CRISPR-associated protein Csx17